MVRVLPGASIASATQRQCLARGPNNSPNGICALAEQTVEKASDPGFLLSLYAKGGVPSMLLGVNAQGHQKNSNRCGPWLGWYRQSALFESS